MSQRSDASSGLDKRLDWLQVEARLDDEGFMPYQYPLFRQYFGERHPESLRDTYRFQRMDLLAAIPGFRRWLQQQEDERRSRPAPSPEIAPPDAAQRLAITPAAQVAKAPPAGVTKVLAADVPKFSKSSWSVLGELYQNGPCDDADGSATARLAIRNGRGNSMPGFLALLTSFDAKGLIERKVRGKRTYGIVLTEEGLRLCRERFGELVSSPQNEEPASSGASTLPASKEKTYYLALEYLYKYGPVVSQSGSAVKILFELIGGEGATTSFSRLLTDMVVDGVIAKDLGVSRCYSISLTQEGRRVYRIQTTPKQPPLKVAASQSALSPESSAIAGPEPAATSDPSLPLDELVGGTEKVDAAVAILERFIEPPAGQEADPAPSAEPEAEPEPEPAERVDVPIEALEALTEEPEPPPAAAITPLLVLNLGREGEELSQVELEKARRVLDLLAEMSTFEGFRSLTPEQRQAVFDL